ncbi:hypothetical protein EYS14_12110 [Alteromonadaceae bacterium M269]|nr:hypothetical protein EYS14_12110 [Alteromonadaceae bacterium M269]
MLGLFKSEPLISENDREFQIASFKWLLGNFGGDDFYKNTYLVLPTKEYFPSQVQSEDDVAIETFKAIKKHANMVDWPCSLKKQQGDVDAVVAPTIVVQNTPKSPLGTFQVGDKDEAVITYNPNLVGNPTQLVATLAHELAHYLTASGGEEPPGGWENWEFATDIAATFMGFGIFMANSAFNFTQFSNSDSQGWQSNRSGYLSESEHIYALAIFLQLKKLPSDKALTYLKPHLRKLLKKAMKEINELGFISELSTVKLKPQSTH